MTCWKFYNGRALLVNPGGAQEMGLREARLVRESAMPADLKYIAVLLAEMYNPKKGDNIYISLEKLAREASLHPVTVSQRLSELAALGVFPVLRRGGRRTSPRTGKVGVYTTRRTFVPEALARDDWEEARALLRQNKRAPAAKHHLATSLSDKAKPATSLSHATKRCAESLSHVAMHKESTASKENRAEEQGNISRKRADDADASPPLPAAALRVSTPAPTGAPTAASPQSEPARPAPTFDDYVRALAARLYPSELLDTGPTFADKNRFGLRIEEAA
jgi:hypothetical protein